VGAPMTSDSAFPWHRVFHPLCGADMATLIAILRRNGLPSRHRLPAFGVVCAMTALRAPFTLLERVAEAILPAGNAQPPIFVIGHPRSGTTHLHNALAASGAFTTVPPVVAALPHERHSIGPILRPFIEARLPPDRMIDGVRIRADDPVEDELALANIAAPSYFHAIYFPRNFAEDYAISLMQDWPAPFMLARRKALKRYVFSMSRRGSGPLLLKNPAYTARPDLLLCLFPSARIIHIRRNPQDVYASACRALRTVLAEMSFQEWSDVDIDSVVLETYPKIMAESRRRSHTLPSGHHLETSFESLTCDPEATLKRIWEELDLPGGDGAAEASIAYCRSLREYRPACNRLSARESELVGRRWACEIAAFRDFNATYTARFAE
jgi:omega-hydroxy-beta-dihydromenaquinone-9 sulfotransferase